MQTAATTLPASQPRWYVIQCKLREEVRALEHLERQGFACYLPTLNLEKLRHGRRLKVGEPLFPRYLFIRLSEISDNWHPIRSTRGVIQVVRFGECPTPVPERIIRAIQERLTKNPPTIPHLKPGERVRITEGCFADLEAIFVANDGTERVFLLMEILHREQTLSFPAVNVSKVQKSRSGMAFATVRSAAPGVSH